MNNQGETLQYLKRKVTNRKDKYDLLPTVLCLIASFLVIPSTKEAQALPVEEVGSMIVSEESPEGLQETSEAFGTKGDQRWYIQGGGGTNVDEQDGSFGLLGVGISHFFAKGHSINAELNGLVVNQAGDDAAGLNLALLLRWDVYRRPNWSLYLDGGAGVLGTTNNVPSGGSSFNFTPQFGAGATIRVSDEKRLMLGLRWYHISNAELYERNPGQDSIMGYVGFNLPR